MTAHTACYGRLGDDPREIETRGDARMAVASLEVAVEEHGTDDPPPLWLGLVAFGRQAEALLRHRRGDIVSVSGRLQLRRYAAPCRCEERIAAVAEVRRTASPLPKRGRPVLLEEVAEEVEE